jgi:hypothetical protein
MTARTASGRLRAKLDLAYPVLRAQAERIWSSPVVRDLYPAYLRAMHTVVRSAVPLIEAARDRAAALAPNDAVATGLVAYLTRHAGEEAGHDQWLLEDLKATGADPEEPLRAIPSARVATLVGAQYYWLRHHHPVSLLGHMAAIEGYHPPMGFAKRLGELTGYPDEAFRAIARHERLDIHHKRALYTALDELPLTPEHETMIGLSGLHTMQGAIDVLAEVYAGVGEVNHHQSLHERSRPTHTASVTTKKEA